MARPKYAKKHSEAEALHRAGSGRIGPILLVLLLTSVLAFSCSRDKGSDESTGEGAEKGESTGEGAENGELTGEGAENGEPTGEGAENGEPVELDAGQQGTDQPPDETAIQPPSADTEDIQEDGVETAVGEDATQEVEQAALDVVTPALNPEQEMEVEALKLISDICERASAFFREQTTQDGTPVPADKRTFPPAPDAGVETHAEVPKGKVEPSADFSLEVWKQLGFAPEGELYCRYAYFSGAEGLAAWFEVVAECDPDGDGVVARFTRHGAVDQSGEPILEELVKEQVEPKHTIETGPITYDKKDATKLLRRGPRDVQLEGVYDAYGAGFKTHIMLRTKPFVETGLAEAIIKAFPPDIVAYYTDFLDDTRIDPAQLAGALLFSDEPLDKMSEGVLLVFFDTPLTDINIDKIERQVKSFTTITTVEYKRNRLLYYSEEAMDYLVYFYLSPNVVVVGRIEMDPMGEEQSALTDIYIVLKRLEAASGHTISHVERQPALALGGALEPGVLSAEMKLDEKRLSLDVLIPLSADEEVMAREDLLPHLDAIKEEPGKMLEQLEVPQSLVPPAELVLRNLTVTLERSTLHLIVELATAEIKETLPSVTATTITPEEQVCPEGSQSKGEVGKRVWCEREDGTRNGPYTMWYDNGQLSSHGVYVEGEQEGVWVTYHENGKKRSEGPWKAGKGAGTHTKWWDNGNKRSEGKWFNGSRCGPWMCWTESGLPASCDEEFQGDNCMLTETGADCSPCEL